VFVELIEHLRCPNDGSHLVATADVSAARHIVAGLLGCPTCGREFPIEGGVARFGSPLRVVVTEGSSVETATQLAAFLELTDANGFAILVGTWCAFADDVRRITETPLVLVNPPANVTADAAAVIQTATVIPFAPGSARALALDQFSTEIAESAVATLRAGGRIVGRVPLDVPSGVTELVRDEGVWVGEKTTAPGSAPSLVELRRAGR
jgi:uncharacterized protein YbaR (Trm112 family)